MKITKEVDIFHVTISHFYNFIFVLGSFVPICGGQIGDSSWKLLALLTETIADDPIDRNSVWRVRAIIVRKLIISKMLC